MIPVPERITFIGVSTKMYLGYQQTVEWLGGVRVVLEERPQLAVAGIQPFVMPSLPLLLAAQGALEGTSCWIGAQDSHWEDGAATGEVSAEFLAELGVSIVTVGHAERRLYFGDTDEIVAKKTAAIVSSGLVALLCVGELDPATDTVAAARYCADQVLSATNRAADAIAAVIVAYEPVWAIGAEKPSDAGRVNEVVARMRSLLEAEVGVVPRAVLYGGSAGPGTLAPLTEIDGLFLGRFAHDVHNLAAVLDEALTRGDLAR